MIYVFPLYYRKIWAHYSDTLYFDKKFGCVPLLNINNLEIEKSGMKYRIRIILF